MVSKQTPLYNAHLQLGAKMVSYAGFTSPLWYANMVAEHLAVREAVGVFDVSHMGEFTVKGSASQEFLQSITTNDVSKLAVGQAQYSCMTNENGGIVDDLVVYRTSSEAYMLVVNAGNIEKDWLWINNRNQHHVMLDNVSDEMCLLAIQGPNADRLVQRLADIDISKIKYYHCAYATFAHVSHVLLSNTGYTGSGGFEVYVNKKDITKVWQAILDEGKADNICPVGLGARDTLRLEKGFCLYGNDIDETTSPLEAGLGWITKLKYPFVGSEFLIKQKSEGINRKLVAFSMEDRAIARQGYTIQNLQGTVVGKVTSGAMSPMLKIGIGLGYVAKPYVDDDTSIYVDVRGRQMKARIQSLPFV